MAIKFENIKPSFPYRFVYTSVNNFQLKAIRFYLGRSRERKKVSQSWPKCAENAIWDIRSVLRNFKAQFNSKEKDMYGWPNTRIESVNYVEKVKNNHEKNWDVRSYEILEWLNQKEHKPVEEVNNLWKVKAHYETSKLNMMQRNEYVSVKNKTTEWQQTYRRSYQAVNKLSTKKGSNDYNEWEWVFRQIARSVMSSEKSEWKICYRNIAANFKTEIIKQ